MAVEKRLAFSIVQFLRDQTHCGTLNSDEQESLEGRSTHCTYALESVCANIGHSALSHPFQSSESAQTVHTLCPFS